VSRLEPYRKLAKQLVRWHRAGNYSIGGRIRGLPRYQHLTDADALKLKFPLGEAQEIVAREAGFESWAKLKAHVESAPAERVSSRVGPESPTIRAAIPVLFVSNVATSAEFFRDKLGFAVDFLHGHPAFYGGVSRDGVTLHLRFVHEPVIPQNVREEEELLAAFVTVENVKALFDEYKKAGVPLVGTLHKEAWGGPTFTVEDLDGNRICFSAASTREHKRA
jgi:catechol 2,3-dioxygenase-like lactoylglutathione lyase family enzyme